jgi:hypothetical protein
MAKSGVITGTGTVTGSDGNSGVKDEGGKTAQAFLFSELFNAENAFGTFGKDAQGVASETIGIFD